MLLAVLLQVAGNDAAVHYTLGGTIMSLAAHAIWRELRERRSNGNGNGNGYGPNSYEYWRRMREEVTDPIVEALEKLKK